MKQNLDGNESGIDEMPNELKKNEWIIIGNKKKWIRICPKCKSNIFYNSLYNRNRSNKQNKECKSCCKSGLKNGRFGKGDLIKGKNHPMFGKQHSTQSKNKMSIKRKKYCLNNPDKNPSKLDWVNKIKSEKLKGINNPMYGKCGNKNPMFGKTFKHSSDTIKNMRIRRINEIVDKHGFCFPNFNKKSIEYFKKLEKENGWDGKYATKNKGEYYIPELGYFVDYYEPTLNIVVEYDEPHHFINGKLKEKDIIRMNEIKNHLHCQFLRYNEQLDKQYEL